MTFKAKIEKSIKDQENTYKSHDRILSDYNNEQATVEGYNGRQLLELLQNADDAGSDKVLIKLDTQNKTLKISNTGEQPFSDTGIKSIMIAHRSPKNSNQYIGNKGLGFRSIINWADEITIHSNDIKLSFSQELTRKYYKELIPTKEQRQKIKQENNLSQDEIPMAILAIPKIEEKIIREWTTCISIYYKEIFLTDIKKQIEPLKAEVLLFLNHIQQIIIEIDGNKREIVKPTKQDWQIKKTSGKVPAEHLNKNNKNNQYEFKIAYNDELDNKDNKLLFSYFPTKININFPFIVHGTFELDSSRNQLTDNNKNKYLIQKLVEFIIETALSFIETESNYKTLEFLQYKDKNEVLKELGFYTEIDKAVENKAIYPCVDNKYRKKSAIVYSNDFAKFIEENGFFEDIPYLLKPTKTNQELLKELELDGFDRISKDGIKTVNKKIDNNTVRTEFIWHLVENKFSEKLPLLTSTTNQLISLDDDIYAPASTDFSLPDYVHIEFIHQDLFDGLIKKFDLQKSKEKLEKLKQILKNISNIRQYDSTGILKKVVASTNKELGKDNADKSDLIQKMVQCLYKNYQQHQPVKSCKGIQLLDQKQNLQKAEDLYLSKTYPSGELTQELFGDIFSPSDFLADMDIFNLCGDKQKIEDFFLWLGVNQYTKFEPIQCSYTKFKSIRSSEYGEFIKECEPECYHRKNNSEFNAVEIANFDEIKKQSKTNLILWLYKDKKEIIERKNDTTLKYSYYVDKTNNYKSYVSHQVKPLFKDYLISDNQKLNNFVNNEPVEYENELFKKYNINKSDINSLLLKLGAVEKFSELSFDKITQVLQSLPEKDRKGKIAQTIYLKSFGKEQKEQKEDLFSDIDLFAKKGEEQAYFSQNEVYYSGKIKLPKQYTDTLAMFDYPVRVNAQKITNFFGIKDLSKTKPSIEDKKLADINAEFQERFKKIKPYILAYRIEDLEKGQKEEEAKKLNKLKIELYQDITCKINNNECPYPLSNYDYLIDDDNSYLIKTPNKNLDEVLKEYYFCTVFSDIIGLVFVVEITDKFKNCIKDSDNHIKQDINKNIGKNAVNDARELLGISSDFYHFWHTIYQLKGKDAKYTDKHNYDFALINNDLSIEVKDNDFKYEDINSKPKQIIDLFSQLEIKIVDFNKYTKGEKIDLSAYHQKKLENCFLDNRSKFKQCLYQDCINKSLQKEYLTKLNQYEYTLDNYATQLEVDYQAECEGFIKKEFGFSLQKMQAVNIEEIYRDNKKLLAGDFEYVERDDRLKSRLCFDNGIDDDFKQQVANKKEQEQKQKQPQEVEQPKEPKKIVPANLKKCEPKEVGNNVNSIQKSNSRGSYAQQNRNKERAGQQAEEAVNESLINDYGADNVIWVSEGNKDADHDFKYKDRQGKWWYVEVKTESNNKFYISKNEKAFAESHKDSYQIFLVGDGDTIHKIYPVDFDKLEVEGIKYSVPYNLESN